MNLQHKIYLFSVAIVAAQSAVANADEHEHDHGSDPLLTHLMLDQLEERHDDKAATYAVKGQLWVGKDLNKLWLKSDLVKHDDFSETELQVLYSHAATTFWDVQLGVRHDSRLGVTREWGVAGVQGLAPYGVDVDAALFVGESGKSALHISSEYDALITQRLILTPEIEFEVNAKRDEEVGAKSGLTTAVGLRLRYEIQREFAPYVGLHWSSNSQDVAYVDNKEDSKNQIEWLMGVRIWF